MNYNMKSKISFGLSALMLIGLILASCAAPDDSGAVGNVSNTDTTPATTSVEAVTEPEIREELPDITFDDYDFRVINVSQDIMTWITTPITAVEETADVINDAFYRSTMTVTEKYGFKLTEFNEGSWVDVANKAKKSINSGANDYDVILNRITEGATLAVEGMLVDYNSIPYVDISKPWWDSDMRDQLSMDNKLYFMAGDMQLTHYDSTCVLMFNKQMLADHTALENPYELVKAGNWTLEKFKELSTAVVADLNGDGSYDENDRYGYVSLNFLMYPSFVLGADQHLIVKDSDDMPLLNLESQAFQQTYSTIVELLHTPNMVFDADLAGDHRLQEKMFMNNQALFWTELVNWSMELRSMENDFGILPIPKMDTMQQNYSSYVFLPNVLAVPTTNIELERTGVILEALCAEGHRTVIPAYYEKVLKSKVSRDNESEEMLDVIFANRNYDLAYIYWTASIGDPFIAHAKNDSSEISTWVAKNLSKAEMQIEKTLEKLFD